MNDSIHPVRFVPQINKLNPKGRTGDKKGNNESKKDFSKHMSAQDKGVDDKSRNQVKEDSENVEHNKQNNEDSLQEKNDHGFDNSCGTILDIEI